MKTFATNLRARAKELGLSNAEVARRIPGMTERRYAHYITARTEPDLASLIKIAEVLRTTPDSLLGVGDAKRQQSRLSTMKERLALAADSMNARELEQTVIQAEAVAMVRR